MLALEGKQTQVFLLETMKKYKMKMKPVKFPDRDATYLSLFLLIGRKITAFTAGDVQFRFNSSSIVRLRNNIKL